MSSEPNWRQNLSSQSQSSDNMDQKTYVFDINRLKSQNMSTRDISIIKQIDSRYFHQDYDPIPDVLDSIDIPTDFMISTQERLNAKLGGLQNIDPSMLALPP